MKAHFSRLLSMQLLLLVVAMNSCSDPDNNVSLRQKKNGSARQGGSGGGGDGPVTNWLECESGYHYDPGVRDCVLDQEPDFNPSTINFDNSQANITQYQQNSNFSCRVTPSVNFNSAILYRAELYYQGSPLAGEVIFFTIKSDNNKFFTHYFDEEGSNIGTLIAIPTNNGYAFGGMAGKGIKGFASQWARCIKALSEQMTDGSILGSASTVACMAFGAECAVAAGIGCAIGAYGTYWP